MLRLLRRIPFRLWLLLLLLLGLALSAINPTDPRDFVYEHLPTVAFLLFIIVYERRSPHGPLSPAAYTLLFGFISLHVLGAHYLYSNVPYDTWSETVLGRSISDVFGWERNHYDRLVHFLFGLLLLLPMVEFVQRWYSATTRLGQLVIAVLILAFLSQVYEWAEWVLTMMVSPEQAENYNGQQGDMFDAQKDMALAFVGSLIAAGVMAFRCPPALEPR